MSEDTKRRLARSLGAALVLLAAFLAIAWALLWLFDRLGVPDRVIDLASSLVWLTWTVVILSDWRSRRGKRS